MDRPLNVELLDHNECFGCGHENPRGLHIQGHSGDSQSSRLRGAFYPDDSMCGFPGITHGGALFTEGTFKEIPMPVARFLSIAGAKELPENWQRFIDTEVG